MTPDQIRQKYLRVIRRPGVTEEIVHGFLAQYPALLPVLWPYDNLVFSKLPLGSQYVVDFAFARENTGGVTWHLLEIERPGDSIFSRAGDPAARLVHGMRQLADWTAWFRDNRDYVRRHFPFGSKWPSSVSRTLSAYSSSAAGRLWRIAIELGTINFRAVHTSV